MKERYTYLVGTNLIHDVEDNYLYSFNNLDELIKTLNKQDKRIKELELLLKADKKIETNSLNGFEKLRHKNQQLKQSQKQLAIEELEKVKTKFNGKRPIDKLASEVGLELSYTATQINNFIENQIQNLKE